MDFNNIQRGEKKKKTSVLTAFFLLTCGKKQTAYLKKLHTFVIN